MHVCYVVCLYKWNFRMFTRCLLLRIEYVNDFFIVVYMNGICGCFYNLFISVKVFVSLLIDMN